MKTDKYDVVVVGGGTGGAPAAICAARLGAKVLLIEKNGFLGGAMTGGLMAPWPHWLAKHAWVDFKDTYIEGIYTEILGKLNNYGALGEDGRTWDDEVLKFVLEDMCGQAGVQLQLHSYVFNVFKADRRINAVETASKSGVTRVYGNIFIDGTGDADLVALAGGSYETGRKSDGATQPMTMMFRMGGVDTDNLSEFGPFQYIRSVNWTAPPEMPEDVKQIHNEYTLAVKQGKITVPRAELHWWHHSRPGVVHFNTTRIQHLDATNVTDLTKAEIEGKRQVMEIVQFLKRFPAFKNAYLLQMGNEIGIRESRRIVGGHTLTREDILSGRKFSDSIARGHGPVDIHDPSQPASTVALAYCPDYTWYSIPYRCLLPADFDNVIVGSKCISATHEAFASVRLVPQVAAIGQAAGTAAALASAKNSACKTVDLEELQKTLRQNNAKI